jgi:hypothetical protein
MSASHAWSNLPTVAAAVRGGADGRATRLGPVMPVEAWCRASTLLCLRRQDDRPSATSGFTPGAAANSPRDDWRAFEIRACFAAACLVVGGGRLLLRAGLIRPRDAATILRLSSWLTGRGMQRWHKRWRREPS